MTVTGSPYRSNNTSTRSATTAPSSGDRVIDDEERLVYSSHVVNIFNFVATTFCGTWSLWRFSIMLARNSHFEGCLATIIVWLIMTTLFSVPMTILMLVIGRYTGNGVILSFRMVAGRFHSFCSVFVTIVILLIASLTSIMLGWSIFYTYKSMFQLPVTLNQAQSHLNDFSQSATPWIAHTLVTSLTGILVVCGPRFYHRFNVVTVVASFSLMIGMTLWSVTRDKHHVWKAMTYLFTLKADHFLRTDLLIDVAFYSVLDAGVTSGVLVTSAAYCRRNQSVIKWGWCIPFVSFVFRLLSAMFMFNVVFTSTPLLFPPINEYGSVKILSIQGDSFTGLTFDWLPLLLATHELQGKIVCCTFFVCLTTSLMTSQAVMLHTLVRNLEDMGVTRVIAVILIEVLVFVAGCGPCVNADVRNNQEYVWRHALLLSAFVFTTIVMGKGLHKFRDSIANLRAADDDFTVSLIWCCIVTVTIPTIILALFFYLLFNLAINSNYEDKIVSIVDTYFLTTVLQWSGAAFVSLISTLMLVYFHRKWRYCPHLDDVNYIHGNCDMILPPVYSETDPNQSNRREPPRTPPPSYIRSYLASIFRHRIRQEIRPLPPPPAYSIHPGEAVRIQQINGLKFDDDDEPMHTSSQYLMTYGTQTQTPWSSRETQADSN